MAGLPWVKLHTGLIDNDAFRLLSVDARLTFLVSLAIAGKQDQGGKLFIRNVGAMTEAQIAGYTGLSLAHQKKALKELASVGNFMTLDEGTWTISLWAEKAGDHSRMRVSRYRNARYGNDDVTLHGDCCNGAVTLQKQKSNAAEVEEEVDKEKEKEKEKDIRGFEAAASPAPVKPRMVRPTLPEVAPDAFGALEPDVAIFVALAAAENRTGAISTGRIESIRRELAAVREEFPATFAEGLRAANAASAPSKNYVRKVCAHAEKRTPVLVLRPETIDDEPMPQYIREAIELHDRDFGGASAGGAA